jgi:hypothetical protein
LPTSWIAIQDRDIKECNTIANQRNKCTIDIQFFPSSLYAVSQWQL